jgi:hypothetical protein
MTPENLRDLTRAVQRNCHISDARHGADYSLCVYLMKMREYYRWERGMPFGSSLGKDEVGNWLAGREQLWETLEDAEFEPLTIGGEVFDPFDATAINDRLAPLGLAYGGGLGHGARPHFVLGDLEGMMDHGGYQVLVIAREHARDLAAPPAMTLGCRITLRRESLRRLLWEKLESWRWSRPDNALGRAFACYDFEDNLDLALDAMTDREIQAVLLHEEGEFRAGQLLGDGAWGRMLLDLVHTPAEIMARAVRDHLADCLVTLPTLARQAEAPPLHFYLGNLTAMRKELFPGLVRAYEDWVRGGDPDPILAVAEQGARHWEQLAREMLAIHAVHAEAASGPIRQRVLQHRL